MSTVAGFTAEIGASGSFCPSHLRLPVTTHFYSIHSNGHRVSSPYIVSHVSNVRSVLIHLLACRLTFA